VSRLGWFLIGLFVLISLQEASSMDTITLEQAQRVARQRLDEVAPQHQFVIMGEKTKQFSFGWVFYFAPKKFFETRSPSDLVPGYGPLVVDKDRTAQFLPSSIPPEVAIENHRREWEAAHPSP
jgi:hypothetical protein